jgi:DNA modification methylase
MSTFIIYEGDNLAIMRELPSETIDLIYIDPPYFSQRDYGDFDDRWKSM